MIVLSKKHLEIIYRLILNKERVFGSYGLTSNGLSRAGVNRQTFRINKEFLLQNYLISYVSTENHGKQMWKFYDVTPLGFLTAYQNILQGKARRRLPSQRSLEKYFPIVWRNWEYLSEVVQKYSDHAMEDFLEISIDGFSIDNHRTFFQEFDKNSPINTRINLNFGFYDIAIKSEFHFEEEKFSFKRRHNVKPKMDDRDLFMRNVRENFTFLFFFNMFPQKESYVNDSLSKQLISVINEDSELNQIFNNKVKFTFKFVNEKPLIEFLSKKVTGQPRLVLSP